MVKYREEDSPFLLRSEEKVSNDILWLWLEIFMYRLLKENLTLEGIKYYRVRADIVGQILMERNFNA